MTFPGHLERLVESHVEGDVARGTENISVAHFTRSSRSETTISSQPVSEDIWLSTKSIRCWTRFDRLHPRGVYVYAMGQEPWLTSIKYKPESRPMVESDKLVAECRSRGLMAERLFGHRELLLDSEAEPAKVSIAYQGMSAWN